MTRQDVHLTCTGLAAAVAIGLLTGAAMKPDLGLGDRPEGPQMFSFGGGARSTGPFDDGVSLTSYGENVPRYVTGTDLIAEQLANTPADEAYQSVQYAEAPKAPAPVSWSAPRFEPEFRTEVSFPSMAGGATYGVDPPGPAVAPSAVVTDDPLVTGDFAPAAEPAT